MPGKELVLVGGGHAHIQVLHALRSKDFTITLVSDVAFAPYSGMLPGCLAGSFKEQELVFDLALICRRFGFRFIHQAVTSLDKESRVILLGDGQKINFDICSLNVGILPRTIQPSTTMSNVIYVKPISTFLKKWREATEDLDPASRIVVIGGGSAAFELAIASALRFPGQVSLISGEKGLTLPQGASKFARRALADLRIELSEGQKVEALEDNLIKMSKTTKPFDLALVAITARPSEVIRHSDLLKNHEGHVVVDAFLQVEGSQGIFAAGDCVHFSPSELPKAGVYAVRQGPILAHNLLCALRGEKNFKRYVPQKSILSLLISGKKEAIFCWRGIVIRGHWVWRLKQTIDKKFMRKFS